MFWLDWLLGLVFAAFLATVLVWVFGVLKRRVERQIAATAKRLNLELRRHPFRYASLHGSYRGRAVSISLVAARSAGLGTLLVADGAPPGLAALDVGTVTLVRMTHGLPPQPARLLDPGPPPIAVRGQELHLVLPGIRLGQSELRQALQRLARQAQALQREDGAGASTG
jgi:hypothetical protein